MKDEDATTKIIKDVVKHRAELSDASKKSSQANMKALDTIFAGVDLENLK